MVSLRLATISLVMVSAACGAGARYQAIGSGRTVVAGAPAAVGPGADATAGMAAAVALPADRTDSTYKVDVAVWLPRAMVVDWTVRCGAATRSGIVGETFEHYRERRLVELRAVQRRNQQAAAAVGSLVGDAVIGQTQASAAVATPNAQAEATVAVDGAAVGAAAGAAMVSTDVELAHGDLGQGYRKGSAMLLVAEANPGACAVELAPRDGDLDAATLAYLTGTFAVARLDDTAHWQAVRARKESLVVRADLRARLIAGGGDVELRWKRAEAARIARASARAERDRLAHLEGEARLSWSMQIDGGARATRRSIYGFLTLHGADPGYRARLAAELEARRAAERAERDARANAAYAATEARWRAEREIRWRLRGQCIGRGGDPTLAQRLEAEARAEREHRVELAVARDAAELEAWRRGQAESDRRAQMALGIRAELSTQLTGRGAIVKPAMPELVAEMPGEPPAAGYAWSSGEWMWSGVEWRWMNGHWIGPTTGGAVVAVPTRTIPTSVGAGVSIGGVTVTVGGTVAPAPSPPPPRQRPRPRPQTQDHR